MDMPWKCCIYSAILIPITIMAGYCLGWIQQQEA